MQTYERLSGINIGLIRGPIKPVILAVSQMGTNISRATIYRMRSGAAGVNIETRINCFKLLNSNNATLKDRLFLTIGQAGIENRQNQQTYPNRFNSKGFIERVAGAIEINNQDDLLSLLRSFRAEIIYSEDQNFDPEYTRVFCKVAENYLGTMTTPSTSTTSKALLRLKEYWNHSTVRDFYSKFVLMQAGAKGTWPPYEAEAIEAFYTRKADRNHHLTPLDKLILTESVALIPEQIIAEQIKQITGIPYSPNIVTNHKNALVYGKLYNPHRNS